MGRISDRRRVSYQKAGLAARWEWMCAQRPPGR